MRGLSTRGNQRSTDLSKAGRPIFSSTAWASPEHFWPGFAPLALVQCYRSATQAPRPSPSIASMSRIAASDHVSPGTSGSSEVESRPNSFSLATQRRVSSVLWPSSKHQVSLVTRLRRSAVSSWSSRCSWSTLIICSIPRTEVYGSRMDQSRRQQTSSWSNGSLRLSTVCMV